MSGGNACRNKEHRPHWRVLLRNAHRSAFNGYRLTASAYSEIQCTQCGHVWRTKAAYVATLPNA
ncbi:hypothetical protein [Kitasatospora sp. NPDC101183]|uniref:hypothetical protein n=1 Tax=Kitasatospora sp. NPDC101183 TaxID=3364100 RepID=UPI0038128AB0